MICKVFRKSSYFYQKNPQNPLMIRKKCLPLHPLTRKRPLRHKRKSSLRDLHRQKQEVVQEARAELFPSLGRNRPSIVISYEIEKVPEFLTLGRY